MVERKPEELRVGGSTPSPGADGDVGCQGELAHPADLKSAAFEGSNPFVLTVVVKCWGSPIGRGNRFRPYTVWVRIPSSALEHYASVAQLAGGNSFKSCAVWVRIPSLVP